MRKTGSKKKAHSPGLGNIPELLTFGDEEWARIANTSPLLKDARFQIGAAIAQYRSEKAASKTSLTTKRAVAKVRVYASKLHRELRGLLADPIFFTAGLPHWSSTPKPQVSDFELLFDNLKQLQSVMERTQSRMQMKPGRKSIRPIDFLISKLNWAQAEITGDNVQRSTKILGGRAFNKYVTLCCQIADPNLTPRQIDRALSRHIANFHDRLSNDGFDTSVGKWVDEKHQPTSGRSRAHIDGHLRFRPEDISAFLRKTKSKRK